MAGTKRQSIVIQERDRVLLRVLADLRVMDRRQAQIVAGFGSVTRVNTRLLKLTRAGLLKRIFLGTIAGGRKAVYSLTAEGAAVAGDPEAAVKSAYRGSALKHLLAIGDVYLAAKHGQTSPEGTTLTNWRTFRQKLNPTAPIIPDGYLELDCKGVLHPLFLEVDLGTETLAVFEGKVRSYLRLAVSGDFQRLSGRQRFRVLVAASGEKRLENLRRTTAKHTQKIFRFTTLDAIKTSGFYEPIWLKPEGDKSEPLVRKGL
ncbi:MAG TPA: replication-relaxation family protein [Acidobacteriota bacterium]|nr:replication-relaxation family protein [Acidobacteriota bacterium]